MGCVAPAPAPTETPVPADTPFPFVAGQLDVNIDPKEAASYLLNPSPLGKGGYSKGTMVTIDILPQPGWQVEEWVGPVFNVDGKTAKIEMDSSQAIAVILKLTIPPTATPRLVPTATPRPTYTPLPTYTPFPTPTATPRPTYTPFPTATPRPTYTPRPTPTARVIFVTPQPTPTGSASSYYNKGDEYHDAENWAMAIEQFTLAIRINPQLEDAYYWRGSSYEELGQYQRAIQLDPDESYNYSKRGYAYDDLGQYQEAI